MRTKRRSRRSTNSANVRCELSTHKPSYANERERHMKMNSMTYMRNIQWKNVVVLCYGAWYLRKIVLKSVCSPYRDSSYTENSHRLCTGNSEWTVYTLNILLTHAYPITRIPKNPTFAKQGLTISGFGFDHFDSCIDSLNRTHVAALSMLPEGMQVSDWQPTEYGGHPALTFSNRLFSRACHAKGVGLVPFNADIDPKGVMREITSSKQSALVHSDENVVHYYKKIGQTKGQKTS